MQTTATDDARIAVEVEVEVEVVSYLGLGRP
jgi:hypothetical protein